VRATFERSLGAVAIEELERDFFSVSAELRSGRLVVHRSGLSLFVIEQAPVHDRSGKDRGVVAEGAVGAR
jgi:predicted acylesterase/phospholipase RssA